VADLRVKQHSKRLDEVALKSFMNSNDSFRQELRVEKVPKKNDWQTQNLEESAGVGVEII
jgi:hypothetical protein